ncbi:MAG: hypothetical protein ACLTXI_10180, partial [Collinsella sp.]
SLDDVMSDRPWTADELMGGGVRSAGPKPTSAATPAPATTPAPASAPADDFATRPIMQAPRQAAPAPRPTSDPSETAAFLAAATQRHAPSSTPAYATPQQPTYAAPEPQPEPELEPPVMDLDDLANRQFAFDSWAAADLDETSAGMPALDIPVTRCLQLSRNALRLQRNSSARRSLDARPRLRIETEGYGSARAHTITALCRRVRSEYNKTGVKPHRHRRIPAAPTTNAADYYTEEEPPRFPSFPAAKIVFIAIIVLLGVIAFEDSSFPRPHRVRIGNTAKTTTSTGHQHPQGRPQRRRRVARVGALKRPYAAPASTCCFVIRLHFSGC